MSNLKEISIFQGLSDAKLKEIEPFPIKRTYRKKDIIFSEGDPSDWFYFVLKGEVKITKLSMDGKEIILEIIHPADFFGGLAVLRGFPYPANAVAREDCEVLRISRENIKTILDRHPDLMMKIMQSIGDRVRDSHETTRSIALDKVAPRIAALLLKLAEQAGRKTDRGTEVDMKLTKQDIAEMVGTTVETSIRTMSRFKKLGLIEEKDGKVIVKNLPGLSEIED